MRKNDATIFIHKAEREMRTHAQTSKVKVTIASEGQCVSGVLEIKPERPNCDGSDLCRGGTMNLSAGGY